MTTQAIVKQIIVFYLFMTIIFYFLSGCSAKNDTFELGKKLTAPYGFTQYCNRVENFEKEICNSARPAR